MNISNNNKFGEPDALTLQGRKESFTMVVDPTGLPKNIIYQ